MKDLSTVNKYRVVQVQGAHHKIQRRFLWILWIDTTYYSFYKTGLQKLCDKLNRRSS